MKITNAKLKQIIKEEIEYVLNEQSGLLAQLESKLESKGFNTSSHKGKLHVEDYAIVSVVDGKFSVSDPDSPKASREQDASVDEALASVMEIVRSKQP